jgi:deoxyribonuclease-4
MPLFGAHMSIAGGYYKALLRAQEEGCDAVQLFTSQPKAWPVIAATSGKPSFQSKKVSSPAVPTWEARPLPAEEVAAFHQTRAQTQIRVALAHDSYLINLASPNEGLYRRSVEAFVAELDRAERLGLDYLVTHPGAHVGSGEEAGHARVAGALDEVHGRCSGYRVQILLETTAGQGTGLGYRFEHLASILSRVAEPDRLGVCLDTCHVFAAGYPLAPRAAYEATLQELDRLIGLDRLRAFHVNDSLKPLGSRVDRHAHIGRGCLGLEPFRLLVNDRRFRDRPMILETPKEEGETDMDALNLGTLRSLVKKRR